MIRNKKNVSNSFSQVEPMSASIPPAGIARERTVLWGVFVTLKSTEIVRNMIFFKPNSDP